jgi:hypothetical protein
MTDKVKRTGGTWDRDDWPMYFIAANPEQLELSSYDQILLAVNEIESAKQRKIVRRMMKAGSKLLIDSGVFNLAAAHADVHGVTHDVALNLAPDKIDGFTELFDHYVELIREFGDGSWGYIEIDQGGRENKQRTRTKLEKLGLRPIPVYHPFNDGWDYFDHLAENYDRICFGNVVNADADTRKRLVATAWERRRKYPHLWIHLLGLTPSELTLAFPCNSCDSSTWVSNIRWGQIKTHTATQSFGELGPEFSYHDRDPIPPKGQWRASYTKAIQMAGYEATMTQRIMTQIADDQKRLLGADIGMFEPPQRKHRARKR